MGPFIQFYGTHVYLLILTDTLSETKKDAEDYIKRTNAVPKAIGSAYGIWEKKSWCGIYSPNLFMKKFFASSSTSWNTNWRHPLFVSFKDGIDKIDIAEDRKVEMLGDYHAIENFKDFIWKN